MFSEPFTFDKTVRIVGGMLIIAALIILINRLSNVLLPFFAAWFIAYMLNPFVNFLQYKVRLKNRIISILITIILLLAIVAVGVTLFAQSAISEAHQVENLVRQYLTSEGYTISPQTKIFVQKMLSSLDDNMDSLIQKAMPTAYNLLSSSLEYITGVFIIFIIFLYVFFILMDFEDFSSSWQDMVPEKYRLTVKQLISDLASGMDIYFRKQALISFIVAILFSIGFKIVGLRMALSMGFLIGVLNMIPYLHTLGAIPPILVALVQSAQGDGNFWMMLLGIGITFAVVQICIDMILTPNIMGKAIGLKPAVILLALSVWGSLMGVLGMIIALPLTTVIISYYKHFIIEEKSSIELVEKRNKNER